MSRGLVVIGRTTAALGAVAGLGCMALLACGGEGGLGSGRLAVALLPVAAVVGESRSLRD